jgi:glycerol kinase
VEDIRKQWQPDKMFHPDMQEEERKTLLYGWQKAVRAAKAWTED